MEFIQTRKGSADILQTSRLWRRCKWSFQKYVIFKLVNTTDFDVNIDWKYELWYNDKCTTCDDKNENELISLTIKAKSEIEGDCSNNNLGVFSEFKNHPEVDKLTKFELKNLNIKQIVRWKIR